MPPPKKPLPSTSINLGGCENIKLKSSDVNAPVNGPHNVHRSRKPSLTAAVSWSADALKSLQVSIVANDKPVAAAAARRRTTRSSDEADDWHDIPERSLTPEQARDLRLIENRAQLDGKRFYKSSGTGRRRGELPTRVHFGTVQVGAHEFFSSRLTRKQRRSTFVEEVLADDAAVAKTHQKFKRLLVKRKINKRIVDPSAKRRKVRRY